MSSHHRAQAAGTLILAAIVVSACSPGQAPGSASGSVPSSASPSAPLVTTTTNVAFESANDLMRGGILDVYAPGKAGDWPTVVMFHGAGGVKSDLMAEAIRVATRGFVVFVPEWGKPADLAADLLTMPLLEASDAQNACAVAFAAAHASEYGGNPSTVILFGHSAGAMAAAALTFAGGTPSAGCLGSATFPTIAGLVEWEGDWLNYLDPGWDRLFTSDPTSVEARTIFPIIGRRTDVPVAMLLGEQSSDLIEGMPIDQLALRDPTGALLGELKRNGVDTTMEVTWAESQKLLYWALQEQGNPVTLEVMPLSSHNQLSDAGWTVLLGAFDKVMAS